MEPIFSKTQPAAVMQKTGFDPWSSDASSGEKTTRSFSDILSESMKQTEQLSEIAENDGIRLAAGDAEDLSQIQINALKAEAAIQTTVQLTSRAVNAYKEILQMQI
ncbi:flagellar hook-basal body complex protein FliE [Acidaminobacterium chupaoyuni]